MPNISVKLSTKEYRSARMWCAQNDTNVSKIVRELLQNLPGMSLVKIRSCSPGVVPPASSTAAAGQPAASAPASQPHASPAADASAAAKS